MHISLQYLHFTKYTKSFTMRINKDTTPVFHKARDGLRKMQTADLLFKEK